MSRTPISPYAKPDGAKRPSLQALRLPDPQSQKAFEAIREWLEVSLGSRGDPYEKAVTLREFEKRLADVFTLVRKLGEFDGSIETLRASPLEALPKDVKVGAFILLDTGELYFGASANGWKKVTLT